MSKLLVMALVLTSVLSISCGKKDEKAKIVTPTNILDKPEIK